jgi:hypothetical protein
MMDWRRCGKQAVLPNLRHLLGIFMEGIRKSMRNLSQ